MNNQIITRRVSESIEVDGVKFTILSVNGNQVRVSIEKEPDFFSKEEVEYMRRSIEHELKKSEELQLEITQFLKDKWMLMKCLKSG